MTFAWVQNSVARKAKTTRASSPGLIVSGSLVILLLLIAIFGPLLAPYDPSEIDVLAAGRGLSPQHPLGTDSLGRDILSRALAGAQLTFLAAGLIVLFSTVLGTGLALLAAWLGGWTDRVVSRALTVMFAVPGILVAILASAVFGAGMWAPVIALSIVYVPYVARVVRSVAVRERKRPYVESLRLAGVSPARVVTRHLLPNVSPAVLAQATFGFGAALLDFAAVSFLGLGIQPPTPEWGVMVSEGRAELLNGQYLQTLVAGSLIVLTVVVFNIFGGQVTARFGGRR